MRKVFPLWAMIICDVVAAGIFLCVFAYFHHVKTYKLESENRVIVDEKELDDFSFGLPTPTPDTTKTQSPSVETETPSTNQPVTEVPTTDVPVTESSVTEPPVSSLTPQQTSSPDVTAVPGPTETSTLDPTVTFTPKPTATPSPTPKPTPTPSPTPKPTPSPSPTPVPAVPVNSKPNYVSVPTIAPSSVYPGRPGFGYDSPHTAAISSISVSEADVNDIYNASKSKEVLQTYETTGVNLTLSRLLLSSGNEHILCYVSDIYVSNVSYLKTAFANGEFSRNAREGVSEMAVDNNAILAISGDYYGYASDGVVIRNGILYRDTTSDEDICVLFKNGEMITYRRGTYDCDELISKGAWQAWSFGPGLLDGNGNIYSSFATNSYIYGSNPRCAIGYVSPGHYIFVVIEGRNNDSDGATMSQLAEIMRELGCVTAYNLDGGASASMVWDGEYVNNASNGGRDLSDIIYIVK